VSGSVVAVLVAAAISLKAPLEEAATRFGASAPGETVMLSFGSSGQLAAQIERGAPVDLFVSASPAEIERLLAAHRIDGATRTPLAGNRLVVVVPKGMAPPADLPAMAAPRFSRVAIGNAKTVPAGRYARDALTASGTIDALERRLVFGENVRQVVDLVARGDAEAGIVYATDVALGGNALTPAFEIPATLHAPILYEGAVIADSSSAARARGFLAYLASAAGREIFVRHGFLPPRSTAAR
jgi:molybdate transport system substrate-binding protein